MFFSRSDFQVPAGPHFWVTVAEGAHPTLPEEERGADFRRRLHTPAAGLRPGAADPDACGNPATVPWQGVVGIESDNDELLYIVSA